MGHCKEGLARSNAQHHCHGETRFARADNGDIQRRTQRTQPAIADSVDQHTGIAIFLGGDARLTAAGVKVVSLVELAGA